MLLTDAWSHLDTARYKAELYRQWHVGQRAGLPHQQVLRTMDEFVRSPTVRDLKRALLSGLASRSSITAVTRAHPALFAPFEAALLELGEESGHLEQNLRLLGDHFTAEHRLMLWVKKKLSYPMINAVLACFIAPFPVLFFGNTALYLAAVVGGLTVCGAAGGSVLLAAARHYARRPVAVRVRLCRALATAIEAGLTLDRAVELASRAADSPELSAHVARISRSERSRQPLARTLAGWPLATPELLAALEIADRTGDYTNTLRRLADLYEDGFR
jgi:type II secretory pathway component PulF